MSITSANPDDLGHFVDAASKRRRAIDADLNTLASQQAAVSAACADYRVESTVMQAARRMLSGFELDERFVATVRTELLHADRDPATGVASVSSTSVAAALRGAGLTTQPGPVEVEPSSLLGLPPTSGFVDDPICAANGNFVHVERDLALPGRAAVLDLARVYNSRGTSAVGAFGPGWSSILDLRISYVEGGVLRAHLADGAIVPFVPAGDDPADLRAAGRRPLRVAVVADGWILHEGHERTWRFDATGRLVAGTSGAAQVSVERDGEVVVALVEERSGRSVRFQWEDNRVVAATSSDGRSVFYRYESGVLVGVDRPTGGMAYGVDGALIVSVADADGVVLATNVYDEDGRVVEQTNELGRTTTYQYSDHGTTLVADTNGGPRNAFAHDRRGNVTSIVDGEGRAMRLTYDDRDRVVMVTDRAGAIQRHAFDERGNLVERVDPDGLSVRWAWDDLDRLAAETHRNGLKTTYEYSGRSRRPVRIVEPNGGVIEITLDELDQPVRVVDADGVATAFEWDADGQPVAMVDALGNRITLEYDEAGKLQRLVDGSGVETSFVNDTGGRVVQAIVAGDSCTYAYTPAGRVAAGSDGAGASWRATYGDHGRATSFTDGEGSQVGLEWDVLGNLSTLVAPDGERFVYTYDAAGRLVRTEMPDGTATSRVVDGEGRTIEATDAAGRTWRREIDAMGRTLVSVAPDGAVTRFSYHPLGLASRIVAPDGAVTTTELDECGRVVAITDGRGERFGLSYSPAGRLQERRFPSGRVERLSYDAAGRLVGRRMGDHVETFELDGRGRVLVDDSSRHGRAQYEYSPAGEVVAVHSPTASTRVERDAGGRVVAVIDGEGRRSEFDRDGRGQVVAARDGSGLESRFGHDVRGRVASQAAAGATTSFGYDRTGFLRDITDQAGTLSRILDPTGLVEGVRYADGSGLDIARDAAGRVAALSSGGVPLASFAYDGAGRLTEAVRAATGATNAFAWDASGSLAAVDGLGIVRDPDGLVSGWTLDDLTTAVERDEAGRVVAVDDPVAGRVSAVEPAAGSVARDRSGRITGSRSGATYRYDAAGRLVEALDARGGRWAFAYGDDGLLSFEDGALGVRRYGRGLLGRLERLEENDGVTTTFSYDAAGRRVRADRSDGTSTRWLWDPADGLYAIERVDADGAVDRIEIVLDGLGRPRRVGGSDVVWDDALSGRPLRVGETRYLHVGAAATVAAPDDPWGSDVAGGEPHAGYRGELSAWGFVWMGARVYDTFTREFLSPDPLPPVPGRPGFASVYAYGFLDPVNFLDPSGERPVSQEEFDAIREREERGRLGDIWHGITEDPWGALAAAAIITAGVVMIATGVGAGVGAGILIGAASGALQGVVTGNFSPTDVAIGGALGAIPGGNSYRTAIAIGAAQDVAVEGAKQAWRGDFDGSDLVTAGVWGGATGGVGRYVDIRIGGARGHVDVTEPVRPRFIVDSSGTATEIRPGAVVEVEVRAPRPVKPGEAVSAWEEFLGDGPYSNAHPRTGAPDADRIVSADGTRSIRYGPHEMGSRAARHHYHEETWTYDQRLDIWWLDNKMIRVPLT